MAFPGTYLGVAVELALGADLTAAPSTWVWTDVTAYVRANGIRVTRGGFDGSIQSPPSRCDFYADNRDGRWCAYDPSGAWFGRIGRGTPIRVVVDEGTPSVRWTGFLTELPPRWNTKETDRFVPVVASGIMRRLERGKTPLESPLVRAIARATTTPVAYWPGEDASGATSIAEYFGGEPMKLTGQVVTLASDGPDGSLPLPEFTTVSGCVARLPTYVSVGSWCVMCVLNFPASPSAETVLVVWYTTGTYPAWRITLTPGSPDTLALQAIDSAGSVAINHTLSYAIGTNSEPFGQWTILIANASLNGSTLDYRFGIYNETGGSGSSTGNAAITAGAVTRVGAHGDSKFNGAGEGHWAVWNADIDLSLETDVLSAFGGWAGDIAQVRANALGNEQRVGVEIDSVAGVAMGVQTADSFVSLLRECEAVCGGRLFENRDPTEFNAYLHLKATADLTNQTAALTLNHDSGHLAPDFQPTDDEQQLRNDWTATRSGGVGTGSSARVVATEGEHGRLTPANVGTYDDSVSVNVYTDDDLIHQAGWRVNLGTVEGLRFPVVTLDFARAPSLIASWITCDIGSRITITNPPAGIAPDSIDLLIEGWEEVFGPKTWQVQLNCSPYKPWHVFRLAETSSDTSVFLGRLAGDEKCALHTAVDADDTSFIVDPNYYRWTTESDDFPLSIRLGGEVCTVSAIATTAATYVGRGALSSADNAAVTPTTTGFGAVDGDLMLCLGRIRGTAGSLTASAGYTLLAQVGGLYLWGAVRSGTTAITVTPAGGAAGDVVSATVFALHNMPTSLADLADVVVQKVTQSNASAQDIAYPGVYPTMAGQIVFLLAGKSDDWTSVAVPAGLTESGEPSTTTGNDQGLYLAYQIQTTPAVVNGGSAVVTGGAGAVSESMMVVFSAGYQTFTVSARNVNGITGGKSHAVGTLIEVEDASVLAL